MSRITAVDELILESAQNSTDVNNLYPSIIRQLWCLRSYTCWLAEEHRALFNWRLTEDARHEILWRTDPKMATGRLRTDRGPLDFSTDHK
jgi:hypothetical protein